MTCILQGNKCGVQYVWRPSFKLGYYLQVNRAGCDIQCANRWVIRIIQWLLDGSLWFGAHAVRGLVEVEAVCLGDSESYLLDCVLSRH